eukprot:3712450-Pleurochrysis_carterae.AAC.1
MGEDGRRAACLRLRCKACLAVSPHVIGGAADAEAKSGLIIFDILENETNSEHAQWMGGTYRLQNEVKR